MTSAPGRARRHQRIVDPVTTRGPLIRVGGLGFHAHADPDIRVEHVRARDGPRAGPPRKRTFAARAEPGQQGRRKVGIWAVRR